VIVTNQTLLDVAVSCLGDYADSLQENVICERLEKKKIMDLIVEYHKIMAGVRVVIKDKEPPVAA